LAFITEKKRRKGYSNLALCSGSEME